VGKVALIDVFVLIQHSFE